MSTTILRRAAAKLLWKMLVVFPLWACAVDGQAQQSSTYQGFEGHPVSKVDVSVDPDMDAQGLRALLVQKEGQAFSIKAIQASVDALQKTNLFLQVQISVEPQQNGLRVLFILQPASYVGMVNFPGATEVFPYARLLQAVNIPEQTAYTKDLVPEGKNALLHLFRTEGFFTATVEGDEQEDKAHKLVNLTFHSHLGPRAKLGKVVLQGVSGSTADSLMSALGSWRARLRGANLPHQTYTQKRLQKAADYLRTTLQGQGHLTPNVRLVSSTYGLKNRAEVTFDVHPGPMVRIEVTGAHVWKRTLKKLIPIYEENSIDPELVAEGQRNLANYFQAKSYFDAKVTSHLDQNDDKVTISYHIDKGTKHRLEAINFEGNHDLPDKELLAHVVIKKQKLLFYHGNFSNDLLKKSTASIAALYKNAGFADVKVTPQVRDHEPQIDVTFLITEGEQDQVRTLQVVDSSGNAVNPKLGKQKLNLAPGKPYSPQLREEDRNHIVAEYLNNGYLSAKFDSRVTRSKENGHLIDVVYVIDEGSLARVGQVTILGQQVTRASFIRTVTTPNVEPGEPLSEGKFLTAESDLYNLGVFDWASVAPLRPVTDQSKEEVLVKVHESKRNTVDVGGGIEVIPRSANIPTGAVAIPGLPAISLGSKFTTTQKSFWGPRVTLGFTRRDLFGKAETGSIRLVFSRLDQRGTFSYTDPYLHGSKWSSLFSVSGERSTQNPIFTAALGQASLQVEHAFDRKQTKTIRARYSFQRTDLTNISIPELVLPRDQHVRTSTFAIEYVRDSRDDPLDAHKGIYQTFSLGITPTALGSSSNFVRFLGQTAFYRPVTSWLTWANNFRLGMAPPFAGSFVPLSELFFSGGPDSLRGFPINGAGPQRPVSVCSNPTNPATCSLISVPVGGEMLAIWNSEGRFPIPLKAGLGGVIFYDGGNVYHNINLHQLKANYSNSIGFGFRYKTPVGPIRIDIGRNLSPIPGIKPTQYFVTIGQAF